MKKIKVLLCLLLAFACMPLDKIILNNYILNKKLP